MSDVQQQLVAGFNGGVTMVGGRVEISRPEVLRSEATDRLVHAAVFGDEATKGAARPPPLGDRPGGRGPAGVDP